MNSNGDQTSQHNIDFSAQRVAKVYAEALLDAADSAGQTDTITEELDSLIQDVFRANPQFEAFLASGAIGRKHKDEVLRSVFAERVSPMFLNFLLVLSTHERLELLRAVHDAFHALRDERAHRIRVQVRAAVPLTEDQRQRLVTELRDSFHLEPILQEVVDPAILGGLVIRVGDWLYDASVRTRIETFRKELIESSSHEIQSRRDQFSSD